ncbi:MAG: squalene synthase HpnC [Gammaproteobacteria bacterium]|nr:squalene synthase HpnC [Gammaproteobacteria bacterium]
MAVGGPAGDAEGDLRHCEAMARSHYENFPVASLALPRRIRRPVAVIYAYSRTVDDLADEGDLGDTERLDRLAATADDLERALAGEPVTSPVLRATARVIRDFHLPTRPFHHLVSAFTQDVVKKRYEDFPELMDYCRRSANPVGRLLLHLTANDSLRNLIDSDHICSALQLINFLQDLEQDLHELGRIYLPRDEMESFGVTEGHLWNRISDEAMVDLYRFQVRRARDLLLEGAPLGARLGGMFGVEIRTIVTGGLAVLDRMETLENDVFARPRLSRGDRLRILWRGISGTRGRGRATMPGT